MPLLKDIFKEATTPSYIKEAAEEKLTPEQRQRQQTAQQIISKDQTTSTTNPFQNNTVAYQYYQRLGPEKYEQYQRLNPALPPIPKATPTATQEPTQTAPVAQQLPPTAPSIYAEGQPLEGRQGAIVSPIVEHRIQTDTIPTPVSTAEQESISRDRQSIIQSISPGSGFVTEIARDTQETKALEEQQEQIDPEGTYQFTDETGQIQTVTGTEAREILQEQIEQSRQESREKIVSGISAQGQTQAFIQATGDMPPGTTYRTTSDGRVTPDFSNVSDENKIRYYEQHGQFKDPQTGQVMSWQQYKQQNPAAVLHVDQSGNIIIGMDYQSWQQQRYKDTGITGAGAKFALGVTRSFDPDWWTSYISGEGTEYIAKLEYDLYQQQHQQKDPSGAWIALQRPAYENIIIPFAVGGGAGFAFRGISSAAKTATGVTQKVLTDFVKTAPKVIMGTMGTIAAADVIVDKPDERLSKILRYGMQFGSAGAGAYTAAKWQPVRGYYQEGDVLYSRKHLTSYRGKPRLPYGPVEAIGEAPTGIVKVVSPTPGSARSFKFIIEPKLKTQIGKMPSWEPDLGYKTVGGKPSSIMDIRPVGKPLQVNYWKGKAFIETGKGWQPQTGTPYTQDWLSTKIWPKITRYKWPGKPIRYGAYNTPYKSVLDFPRILESGSFTTTEGIVKIWKKPISFKQLQEQGIITKDTDTGGITQGQEQISIVKLKPPEQILKVEQEQLLKTDKQAKVETIKESEKISILHPEYKLLSALETEKASLSIFHPLFGIKQKKDTVKVLAFDSLLGLKQTSGQASVLGSLSELASGQAQASELISISDTALIQASMKASAYDSILEQVTKSTHKPPSKTPVTQRIIQPKETRQPQRPRQPRQRRTGVPLKTKDKTKTKGITTGPGYHVFVKEQHIISGKETGKLSYRKRSPHPLSKKEALSLGGHLVDTTPRATFMIKETIDPPKPLKQIVTPWKNIRHKFYTKGNKKIEKRKYRIDSAGEVAGITLEGLASLGQQMNKDINRIGRRTRRLR